MMDHQAGRRLLQKEIKMKREGKLGWSSLASAGKEEKEISEKSPDNNSLTFILEAVKSIEERRLKLKPSSFDPKDKIKKK
jgi:predicted transposase YbfD/YdcC